MARASSSVRSTLGTAGYMSTCGAGITGASTAFHGLLQMEINKRAGDILIPRLIDLAYSTDCCHVVGEALNGSQLVQSF